MKIFIIVQFLVLVTFVNGCAAVSFDVLKVRDWGAKNAYNIDECHQVNLVNKKSAILCTASFIDHRGIESCCTGIIVMPDLEKSYDYGEYFYEVEIYDLNTDNISEIVKVDAAIGQGLMQGHKKIVHLTPDTIKVLHSAKILNNDGVHSFGDPEYHAQAVDFIFKDLNRDGIADLEEVTTVIRGKKKSIETKKYIFNGKNFTFFQ